MLYYVRIDMNKGIDVAKSQKCMICQYWGFFYHGFKSQNSVCNVCHDLTMMCLNFSDIAIITINGVDF